MDRRERSGDLLAAILALQQSWASEFWTALPGIIQSFNPTERTCVVQPSIKAQVVDEIGAPQWVTMPLLLDCPVLFPGGGGVTLTFPLKAGDECLVVFADRCLDSWWQSGGVQVQAELRMHDLSDGVCIPGICSKPKVQSAISTDKAQLRSDDGLTSISVDPLNHRVEVLTTGNIKLQGSSITLKGALTINDKFYEAHTHSNVVFGSDHSGPVSP